MGGLDPAVHKMKQRLLAAPYEICLARALHFTRAYQETEGIDRHLRNAMALRRTLEKQEIFIQPDERLVGSKTEKLLASPLSVERGDFLRSLQAEIDVLHLKRRPFRIEPEDVRLFYDEIYPYWDGRTVRDRKAAEWEREGLIDLSARPSQVFRRSRDSIRFLAHLGRDGCKRFFGANLKGPLSIRRLRSLSAMRHEWARNNPTAAAYCFDVQGHLSLGVDKVVERGMGAIIGDAQRRLDTLDPEETEWERKGAFLEAVIMSLEAAIGYADRFADLADELANQAPDEEERSRLVDLSDMCRRVPRFRPRTFHDAVQAVYFTLLVGEIQYGTLEVFAVGRADQYLYPFLERDLQSGELTKDCAVGLIQELLLKLSANVVPTPDAGMESNGVFGTSGHAVTIGGLTPSGEDGTNDLTWLFLDAFEELGGAANQLCLRVSKSTPDELMARAASVFRSTSGLSFFGDEAVVEGLESDGMTQMEALDYCLIGCVEPSGQSNTHGCPGGHELSLPAVLWLTLSRGQTPPPAPGQKLGCDCGDLRQMRSFPQLVAAFRQQLAYQIDVLIAAVAGKDNAWRDLLPSPYVSALMDDCIERACDITAGGARYDFTSIDVRGLATVVDSLLGIKVFVFDRDELSLPELVAILHNDFENSEVLCQRMIREAPKYGTGSAEADSLASDVVGWIHDLLKPRQNVRGGRYRACYYSYGNHVVDGFFLGATPDGRRRGEPISNGVSPSNLSDHSAGPTGPLTAAAKLRPNEVSSGVSLNIRFHPKMVESDRGLLTFAKMVRTYLDLGGMHVQPNVVSTETLRDAQRHPERHKDLVVKVAGYSAYFTDLGHTIQEDIIGRHEFGT